MGASHKSAGVVSSDRESVADLSPSRGLPSTPPNNGQASPRPAFFKRNRNIVIVGIVAAVVALALILGLALGLTHGHRSTGSNDSSNGSDAGIGTAPKGIYPNPEPLIGTIPNNANYTTLDPTLIRRASDGKYFLYITGAYSGIVWSSPSLRGPWTKSPTPLVKGGLQAGAPDVHQFNESTYIMFHNSHRYNYSSEAGVTNPQAQMLFHDASIIARVSEDCEPGSWREIGRVDIDWEQKWNILDPSLLRIPAGRDGSKTPQALLTFGSYQTGLFQIPLDASFPVQLASGPAASGVQGRGAGRRRAPSTTNTYAMSQVVHLEQNKTNKIDATEGSYMYYRDFDNHTSAAASTSASDTAATGGWYYLFFSSGSCCPEATNPAGLPHPYPHGPHNETHPLITTEPTTYTVSGGVTTYPNTTISWFPYDRAYKVMVCRSRKHGGEYFDREGRSCLTEDGGTLVLASHDEVFAPGGQGVWDDPVEGTVLYYHYVVFDTQTNKPDLNDKGYKFGWNKLDFSDEGWPKVI